MVALMTIPAFSKNKDWDQFNSSLLIEVTRPNGVFTCTGVAVSSEIIMTAAHCLEGDILSVRVFTQSTYNPQENSLTISNYKIHPKYNPKKSRYFSDVAKIKMKDKLPSFIKIHPIFFGEEFLGDFYRFGFGARNKKNLRTVITPTFRKVNHEEHVLELNDEFSRSGDSGGPIFLSSGKATYILAIHSTFSHGPEGNFSLNPLLGFYRDWIFEN